ncbi:MAG: asparagine synthase-related protein, partial [Candidatus Hodarchaeota archaeon]
MGSSIAGVLDKRGRDIFGWILSILSATAHRGSANTGIAIMGTSVCGKNPGELDKVPISGHIGIGVMWNGVEKKFGNVDDSFHGILDGELYRSGGVRKWHSRKVLQKPSDIDTMIRLLKDGIADQLRGKDSKRLIHQKLRTVDGVFALAILHEDRIFIARDPIGVKPIYVFEDENIIAFSSEKKGLWSIGLEKNIYPLDPGSFAIVDRDGVHIFRRSWRFGAREIKLEESVEGLMSVLKKSVEKRVEKHDSVGLLFSGGLDSTILARLTKDFQKD